MKTDTMKNTGLCRRAFSPFDDSATERRRRMGLVSETGEPDQNSIEVLSHVFAAQYFDDLCDFCQSIDDVQAALTPFIDAAEKAESRCIKGQTGLLRSQLFWKIWSLNSGTNWCSCYTASLKHRGLNCGNPTINISALNGISPCMRSANADGLWSELCLRICHLGKSCS